MLMPQLNKVLRVFLGPEKYVNRVRELLDEGEFELARQWAVDAKSRYGNHSEVNLIHAKVHMALQQLDEVRDSLAKVPYGKKERFKQVLEVSEMYQSIGEDDLALEVLIDLRKRYSGWQLGHASSRIGHVHYRNRRPCESLFAFIDAVSDGVFSWWMFMQVLDRCSRDELLAGKQQMEKLDVIEERNAFFYKALSLIESYLGNEEELLTKIQLAAKKRFTNVYPDIPWLESNDPLKPHFLIIGAMKSGTTSLFEQIENHPLFLAAMDKELQFFQYEKLSDPWYLNHFPRVSEFPGFISGDGSPGYYVHDVVDRVKSLCPDVRLIFIRRDPVARAISHLRHNNRQGIASIGIQGVLWQIDELERELLESPEDAEQMILDMCFGKRADNSYLSMGCYEILLRRWRRAFPPEQLMVIDLEDYVENPQGTMNCVFDFIGLEPIEAEIKKSNVGSYIKNDAETLEVVKRLEQFYCVVDSVALSPVNQ